MNDERWSEHPSASVLACYVDRTLSSAEQGEIEAHLSHCADCRRVVTEAAGALSRRARRRRAWVGVGAAAAVAAAVAAVAVFPMSEPGVRPPVMRTRGALEAEQAVIPVVTPTGRASLHERPLSFIWRSMGPDVRYRFNLSTPDGRQVWEASLEDTLVTLPEDIEVVEGRSYVWFVDALLSNGTPATTNLQRLNIEP